MKSWAPARRIFQQRLAYLVAITYVRGALAQALLLAARFFGYRMEPLQSWKLVHMASTTVQQYFYLR